MSNAVLIASVAQPAEPEHEPTAFGLNPGGWVALAMMVVLALLAWKKVHHAIGRALDSKIELIRNQLAEAEALRKEAEAIKAEYEAKAASSDKDRAGAARARPAGSRRDRRQGQDRRGSAGRAPHPHRRGQDRRRRAQRHRAAARARPAPRPAPPLDDRREARRRDRQRLVDQAIKASTLLVAVPTLICYCWWRRRAR